LADTNGSKFRDNFEDVMGLVFDSNHFLAEEVNDIAW